MSVTLSAWALAGLGIVAPALAQPLLDANAERARALGDAEALEASAVSSHANAMYLGRTDVTDRWLAEIEQIDEHGIDTTARAVAHGADACVRVGIGDFAG